MGTDHLSLPALLDLLLGRGDEASAGHLQDCAHCSEQSAVARRLLAAGRGAVENHKPGRSAMARAMRAYREARAPAAPTLLRLVLDSLLRPAPALRTVAAPARFLRYEGPATIELQITPVAGGVELRGQITPADFALEVGVVTQSGRTLRVQVAPDGTFLFARLRHGRVGIEAGPARIPDLTL